jgi:hypothetical protein
MLKLKSFAPLYSKVKVCQHAEVGRWGKSSFAMVAVVVEPKRAFRHCPER